MVDSYLSTKIGINSTFTPIESHVKENFNLLKKSNLKFQNSYKQVLWWLSQGMSRKSLVEKLTEGGSILKFSIP